MSAQEIEEKLSTVLSNSKEKKKAKARPKYGINNKSLF